MKAAEKTLSTQTTACMFWWDC